MPCPNYWYALQFAANNSTSVVIMSFHLDALSTILGIVNLLYNWEWSWFQIVVWFIYFPISIIICCILITSFKVTSMLFDFNLSLDPMIFFFGLVIEWRISHRLSQDYGSDTTVMFQKINNSAKQEKYTYDTKKFRQQLNTHTIAPKLRQTEPFYYQRRVQCMECVHLACQSKLYNPRWEKCWPDAKERLLLNVLCWP